MGSFCFDFDMGKILKMIGNIFGTAVVSITHHLKNEIPLMEMILCIYIRFENPVVIFNGKHYGKYHKASENQTNDFETKDYI